VIYHNKSDTAVILKLSSVLTRFFIRWITYDSTVGNKGVSHDLVAQQAYLTLFSIILLLHS